MNWPYPIPHRFGRRFKVMSLAGLRKLDEDGVTFQSHIDGSTHRLTPERSIEIQGLLRSDIQMQLDECVKLPNTDEARWRVRIAPLVALGRALPASPSASSRDAPCSAVVQGGANEALAGGERARASSVSTSRATPSGGWRSASRRT